MSRSVETRTTGFADDEASADGEEESERLQEESREEEQEDARPGPEVIPKGPTDTIPTPGKVGGEPGSAQASAGESGPTPDNDAAKAYQGSLERLNDKAKPGEAKSEAPPEDGLITQKKSDYLPDSEFYRENAQHFAVSPAGAKINTKTRRWDLQPSVIAHYEEDPIDTEEAAPFVEPAEREVPIMGVFISTILALAFLATCG